MPTAPYGHPDDFTAYFNEVEYQGVIYFKNINGVNEQSSIEMKVMDVIATDSNVIYGTVVKVFAQATLIFKGKVQQVAYNTDGSANVSAAGMEILLAKKELNERTLNWNTTTTNIINYYLSNSGNSVSPWIITPGNLLDFGEAVDFSAQFDNKLQVLNSLAKQLEWDWYINNGDPPYNTDTFNFIDWRGSLAPVFTVNLSGSDQNAIVSKNNNNFFNLYNSIVYLGSGEGNNQIWSQFDLASTTYDVLDQSLPYAPSATLTVVRGNHSLVWPTNGVALIGREVLTYKNLVVPNILGLNQAYDNEGTIGTVQDTSAHYRGTLVILYFDASAYSDAAHSIVQLNGNMSATDTTLNFTGDASGFPAAPFYLVCGREVMVYSVINASSFTITQRGTPTSPMQNTWATAHDSGIYVFPFDALTMYWRVFPQSGSLIDTYGLRQGKTIDPSKVSQRQIELEASNWLLRNSTITYDITFQMMDYFSFLDNVKIGDRIVVNDSDTGLADNFRVLGYEIDWNMGDVQLFVHASNKKITETTFLDKISGIDRRLGQRLTYIS